MTDGDDVTGRWTDVCMGYTTQASDRFLYSLLLGGGLALLLTSARSVRLCDAIIVFHSFQSFHHSRLPSTSLPEAHPKQK
jgi:hypothetical protein